MSVLGVDDTIGAGYFKMAIHAVRKVEVTASLWLPSGQRMAGGCLHESPAKQARVQREPLKGQRASAGWLLCTASRLQGLGARD